MAWPTLWATPIHLAMCRVGSGKDVWSKYQTGWNQWNAMHSDISGVLPVTNPKGVLPWSEYSGWAVKLRNSATYDAHRSHNLSGVLVCCMLLRVCFFSSLIFTSALFWKGLWGSVNVCLIPCVLQTSRHLPSVNSFAPSVWRALGIPTSWINSCSAYPASDFTFIGMKCMYPTLLTNICPMLFPCKDFKDANIVSE